MSQRLNARLESLRIEGFRSLRKFELTDVGDITVLLGGNGSGKSNIIHFFEMLSWMLKGKNLVDFVANEGGADDQLFGGRRISHRLEAEIKLSIILTRGKEERHGLNEYRFALSYAHPDQFFFSEEEFRYSDLSYDTKANWIKLDGGGREAQIISAAQSDTLPENTRKTASIIINLLRNCSAFQFHDTSANSRVKSSWSIDDNQWLRGHGGNLAAILYRIQQEDINRFNLICRQISRILPVFKEFILHPQGGKIILQWSSKWTDKIFGPHLTSDGSLRFFALVTLLNLPTEMLPDVILLDEPELGLHPAAITLIAAMIKQVSQDRQVILATQSSQFVSELGLDAITTLDLFDGETRSRKIKSEDFAQWSENGLAAGDLWMKNLLGGRP